MSCVYRALISVKYLNSLGGSWLLFLTLSVKSLMGEL